MIISSLSLTSSKTFREESTSTSSTTTTETTAVANIENIVTTISGNQIQFNDNSKSLSKVIGNLIRVVDFNSNQLLGEILIENSDISIDDSNSSYNVITITLPTSDFDSKTAILSMF